VAPRGFTPAIAERLAPSAFAPKLRLDGTAVGSSLRCTSALQNGNFHEKAAKVVFVGTWFFYSEWAALARQERIEQQSNEETKLSGFVAWFLGFQKTSGRNKPVQT
jgi:hypothetical protein